jgi:hypothetical protein
VCPTTTDIADLDGSNTDPIDIALAWNEGDPRATIGMLLDDCRHLRLQLALAEAGMSPGFTRGWTPSFERPEGDQQ